MSWCLYLLAKNPEIQEQLYQEVISVCPGDKVPNSDDIAQMPYLKAIIRETLRLEGFFCFYQYVISIGHLIAGAAGSRNDQELLWFF